MTSPHDLQERYRQGSIFPRDVGAEIEISAPIETVWAILSNFTDYQQWNPFTPRVHGELRVGTSLELEVRMSGRNPMMRTEWINRIDFGRCICWGMHLGHPLLLTANRWQTLRPLPGQRTFYSSIDKLSGLLAPLVIRLYGPAIRDGFTAVARALKVRAEQMRTGEQVGL